MRLTIIFGGSSRERLVSVATAQTLARHLEAADLWFWDQDDQVYETSQAHLLAHERPFEMAYHADGACLGALEAALDQAMAENRLLVLGLHGGRAENGEFQVMCEARKIPFTGSGSLSSHMAFDKPSSKLWVSAAGVTAPASLALDDMESALAEHGKLFAKPAQDGSSYGLIVVQSHNDIVAVRNAAKETPYLVEPCITGVEATCGVIEMDGEIFALPPVEIIPPEGVFDYQAKYLGATQEICPARFSPEITKSIQDKAVTAHKILGCYSYSRTDFIVSPTGPVYIETNTLPGMTASSLLPKSLAAQGIDFKDFLMAVIAGAQRRAG